MVGVSWRRKPVAIVVAAILAALLGVGAAQAAITPSTFEGSDGNLVVDGTGNKDWATVGGVVEKNDAASGQSDPSLKGDEGSTVPAVTAGSIQPKADLLNFRVARETAGGKDFLYLGWERVPDTGTVNFDFELNQLPQGAVPQPTANGAPWALNRSKGDLLFTFDLAQGGVTPTLSMLKWQTEANAVCGAPQWSVPCWGPPMVLNPNTTPAAEAGVGRLVDGKIWFGEASINLQGAGIFQSGVCTNFGSAYAKSRSSDSPSASLSDFIEPTTVTVNNCGDLTIVKNTGSDNGAFTFDVNCDGTAYDRSNLPIATSGGTGSVAVADIPNGTSCTVTEDPASGWTLTSTSPAPATVTIDGDKTVTFTNSRDKGKIVVEKTATGGGTATFTFTVTCTGVAGYPRDLTIDTAVTDEAETPADIPTGTQCSVVEKPTQGWSVQGPATRNVTVDEASEEVAFTNVRDKGSITINKIATGGDGAFSFTVDCPDVAGYPRIVTITTTNGSGSASTPADIPTFTTCTVTETAQPGVWTIVGPGSQNVLVDSTTGENVVFSNTRNVGTLTVVVKTEGGNGTFTYDVDCDGSPFDADGSISTTNGSGSAPTIGSIPTGTTCTASQAQQPGWTLTSTSPQSVVIDGDEVLTFVNTRNVNSITVDKTASVQSAAEGDTVTYTYLVRSPGVDGLTSVNVVDDKCSPVVYRSGDADSDNVLDPSETWTYTCQSTASAASPTNIATATGVDPAGAKVEATDRVTITVVAATVAPRAVEVQGVRLPRTGADVRDWALLGGSLILLGLSILFVSRRRRPA